MEKFIFWVLPDIFYTKFFLFFLCDFCNSQSKYWKQKQMFGISYAVVRPKIPSTVLNFVGIKSYTVQIRVVHCTRRNHCALSHLLSYRGSCRIKTSQCLQWCKVWYSIGIVGLFGEKKGVKMCEERTQWWFYSQQSLWAFFNQQLWPSYM